MGEFQLDEAEVRRRLASAAKSKKRRKQHWSRERPNDWRPSEVFDPEWNVFLTTPRAWDLILEWLEDERPIESKQMELPGGELVWVHVMIERIGDQMVYVKLELLGGGQSVHGGSFHVSERTRAENTDNQQ